MDSKLSKTIEKNTVEYLNAKLLVPVFKKYLKHHEKLCYQIFSKELADVFDEYQCGYFENDYHSRVGQYYFSSLYGAFISEKELTDIIKAEEHEDFDGVEIYFEGFNHLDDVVEESVENMDISFKDMNSLIIACVLKELSNSASVMGML